MGRSRCPKTSAEPHFTQKQRLNPEEKKAIAREALPFIENGHTIAFSAGTTTWQMVDALPQENANYTFITNSTNVALTLQEKGWEQIVLSGGIFRTPSDAPGRTVRRAYPKDAQRRHPLFGGSRHPSGRGFDHAERGGGRDESLSGGRRTEGRGGRRPYEARRDRAGKDSSAFADRRTCHRREGTARFTPRNSVSRGARDLCRALTVAAGKSSWQIISVGRSNLTKGICMPRVCVFDVNETLLDLKGPRPALRARLR